MSVIVTRNSKGSPLTFNEADANFTNLNNDKYEENDSPTFNVITGTSYVGLPVFDGTNDGIVPAGSNTGSLFLRDDATWQPAGGGSLSPLQLMGILTFGVVAGNGAAMTSYGLPSVTTVSILGQNNNTPASGSPILRYSYNNFNIGVDWAIQVTSNWKPFYPDRVFGLEVLHGKNTATNFDDWLFGIADSGAVTVSPPQTSQTNFIGFVSDPGQANIRMIQRIAATDIQDLDTGTPKTTVDDGALFRLEYDPTTGDLTGKIYLLNLDRTFTLQSTTVLDTGYNFGSNQNLQMIYGGDASGTGTIAVIYLNGYYQLTPTL